MINIKRLKTKRVIKRALKHPELYTPEEILYFELIKRQRKKQKQERKAEA